MQTVGGQVAETIFRNGLCLPSGTSMSDEDLDKVVRIVRGCWR